MPTSVPPYQLILDGFARDLRVHALTGTQAISEAWSFDVVVTASDGEDVDRSALTQFRQIIPMIPQFSIPSTTVFNGGHMCWLGLQKNFANFMISLGARVEFVGLWTSERHDWDGVIANPANKLWTNPPA